MVLKADQVRVKALLTETITLLCKNGLNYQSEFAIEALIGITLDQDDVFLVSIKETVRTDLGLGKDLDSPDDHREFRIEATRSSQQDIKDGLDNAPDLSIMVQLDKSDDGQLVTSPNGSSVPVPQKLFRSVHGDNTSIDMGDTQTSYSSDSAPSSMTFTMRDFDTGSSTTGGGDTMHRERSIDRSDHVRQPPLKKSRTVDESGDRSVKEESESDEDVVVIKEEAGLDTISCQMDSYNRTGMLDTGGTLTSSGVGTMTQDTISSIASVAAANIHPHTLTLSSSAPVFPGCSTWDQLPSISAHSLPQTTASPSATMSGTSNQQSQQLSQTGHTQFVEPCVTSPSQTPHAGRAKRSLLCRHCSRSFASTWGLKVHEDMHQGVYPYKCPYCSKGFSSQTNLRGHLVRHTGVREFKCSHCDAEYTYARMLRRHLKLSHNYSDKATTF